jgi:hypothetical protein
MQISECRRRNPLDCSNSPDALTRRAESSAVPPPSSQKPPGTQGPTPLPCGPSAQLRQGVFHLVAHSFGEDPETRSETLSSNHDRQAFEPTYSQRSQPSGAAMRALNPQMKSSPLTSSANQAPTVPTLSSHKGTRVDATRRGWRESSSGLDESTVQSNRRAHLEEVAPLWHRFSLSYRRSRELACSSNKSIRKNIYKR